MIRTIPAVVDVEESDSGDDHRRNRCAGERDQVEEPDDEPERDGVGHAENEQDNRRGDAGDEADREIPGHVATDGAVDVAAHLAPARL